jgi:hypothetical protein
VDSGLRRIRIHDLRFAFAPLLIANGESVAYVRDQPRPYSELWRVFNLPEGHPDGFIMG